MTRLPQVLRNVGIRQAGTDVTTAIADDIAAAAAQLGDAGRGLIRSRGAAPGGRGMVEAPTGQQADEVARRLAQAGATPRSGPHGRESVWGGVGQAVADWVGAGTLKK